MVDWRANVSGAGQRPTRLPNPTLGRRGFLGAGVAGITVVGLGGTLTACGSDPVAPRSGGGRLRVGMLGAGSTEVISFYTGPNLVDHARTRNVYDTLVATSPDLQSTEPALAEALTMSQGNTVLTIELRQGVTYHNGRDFTSEDIVRSVKAWMEEDNRNFAGFGALVVPGSVRARGKHVVELKFNTPVARPGTLLTPANMSIGPSEEDGKATIGTGPFVLESFTPGSRSMMKKNPDYWIEGQPRVDELEIVSFSDDTALVNAMNSGQIDAMSDTPVAQIKSFASNPDFQLITANTPTNHSFLMRVDKAPFNDVRVRKAMKLIVDRKQMIEVALGGYGLVGNDLVGPGLPFFLDLPAPEQDIDQAKSLLKAAGAENLQLTLQTSNIGVGVVQAATLFAEQAKAAGVDISVRKEDPAAYFDVSQLWQNMDFAQTSFAPVDSLHRAYTARATVFNETHWDNPEWSVKLADANGADDALAAELYNDVQQTWYDESGYITWNSLQTNDVVSKKVKGLEPSGSEALGAFRFRTVTLDG